MTESVLQEAQRIIHGDRSKSYGHPRDNFQNIAKVWSAYKHVEFTPMDVGLMMVLLKVARLENGEYHRDSVTDIAGYAGTLERIFEEPVDLDEPVSADGSTPEGNPKPAPRVWKSLREIQGTNIEAKDKYGNHWKIIDRWFNVQLGGKGGWTERNRNTPIHQWDSFGPFTEVVA